MTAVFEWVRKQFDPSEEPVRLAVFVVAVVAAVVHRYVPDFAVEIDALALIVTTAWARAKVFPGA